MRRRSLALLASLLLLVPVATARADFRLGAPADVSAAGGTTIDETPVLVANDGDAVAVWTRVEGDTRYIQAAYREAGVWSTPQRISFGANARQPHLAISRSDGSAVAAWSRGNGEVQAAFRPSGGRFGTVQTVASADTTLNVTGLAMNDAGAAVLAWTQLAPVGPVDPTRRTHARAALRSAGGTFGSSVRLSPTDVSAQAGDAAITPGGSVLVGWQTTAGADRTTFRPAGGSFEPAQAAPSDSGFALDRNGNAVMVWLDDVVKAAFRPVGGAWGTPRTLSAPGDATPCGGPSAAPIGAPRLALRPDGTAIASWSRVVDECGLLARKAEVAERPAGGIFGPVQRLDDGASTPLVAIGPDNDALAMWAGNNGVVRTARKPAGGAWTAPADFAGPFEPVTLRGVDTSPTGRGSFVWWRQIGTERRIQSVPFDPPAFDFSFSSVKGLFALGKGTNVPARRGRRGGDPDGRLWATISRPRARRLCFGLVFTRLGRPVSVHVHRAAAGRRGPVVVRLRPLRRLGSGTASGCVSGLRARALERLFADPGGHSIDVHTRRHPRGAVRGQLFAPPR